MENWTEDIISYVVENTDDIFPSSATAEWNQDQLSVCIYIDTEKGRDRIEVFLKPGSGGLFMSVLTLGEVAFIDSMNGDLGNYISHMIKAKDMLTQIELYLANSQDFYMNRLR